MDKTERLFAILDALRRHRTPVTAAALAEEQGVSVRTLYRDVQTLIALGARIEGEAGIGYLLRPGFFLPPLMFGADELEALVLGARWVQAQPDVDLSTAARSALAKIATASPDDLRRRIADLGLWPVLVKESGDAAPTLGQIRRAMREQRALVIHYTDEAERDTVRDIWPVQLAYYEGKQIVAGWCCLREAFRNFRIDRIRTMELTSKPYGRPRHELADEWWREALQRWGLTTPDTL